MTEKEQKQKEALAQIEVLTDQAMEAIRKAETLADEANVSFGFDVEYGMGGTYYPTKALNKVPTDEETQYDAWESSDEGWVSSSSGC